MEGKTPESEIVIKITPRNLERLIYIIIILILLVFSVVMFYKKAGDCPKLECNKTIEKVAATPAKETTEETAEDTEITVKETVEEEKTTKSTGKVDFLLTDVKLCITNETLDKGRFDTVSIYIKNGLDRKLNAKVELYVWDSNDPDELEEYPAQKIEKISILAGAPFTHTYEMTGGMFTELDNPKTVKAVLIDSDVSKILGEQSKTSIIPSGNC